MDMWTSREEIGAISETSIYVMFPYHLAEKVSMDFAIYATGFAHESCLGTLQIIP